MSLTRVRGLASAAAALLFSSSMLSNLSFLLCEVSWEGFLSAEWAAKPFGV